MTLICPKCQKKAPIHTETTEDGLTVVFYRCTECDETSTYEDICDANGSPHLGDYEF